MNIASRAARPNFTTAARNRALKLRLRSSPALITRRTFLTIIEQGHEGWRLALGRKPVKLTPGLNINIPFYHTLTVLDVRESSVDIPNLPGYTADNVPVLCSGSLFFRITDSYKACFAVSEVTRNVQNIGTSAMRSVLGTFTYDQVIADRNGLNQQLNIIIGNSIANWGVECTRFEVQSFQPANREVERQLELQMEAERNRRKQLLDTQAQINVAEGQKQRVILESEGHLEAKSNEADAKYKTVYREAEARQQQALMEATALAQQVESIARALSGSPSSSPSTNPNEQPPTIAPEHRKLALSTLVELKRLEQLKAIAESKSNSTYFFGDKASLGVQANDAFNVDYAQSVKAGIEGSNKSTAGRGRAEGALLAN
ncbi:stomatin family protein [Gymnopilus junonius]|uniref:Stomatin family protein n=1 Tax=Gymnopilus junonius TaxID=109634 RepID=A0A9P5TSU1_GYMJU|nr:stomatin family protein [Gymnopilus junonius]